MPQKRSPSQDVPTKVQSIGAPLEKRGLHEANPILHVLVLLHVGRLTPKVLEWTKSNQANSAQLHHYLCQMTMPSKAHETLLQCRWSLGPPIGKDVRKDQAGIRGTQAYM